MTIPGDDKDAFRVELRATNHDFQVLVLGNRFFLDVGRETDIEGLETFTELVDLLSCDRTIYPVHRLDEAVKPLLSLVEQCMTLSESRSTVHLADLFQKVVPGHLFDWREADNARTDVLEESHYGVEDEVLHTELGSNWSPSGMVEEGIHVGD